MTSGPMQECCLAGVLHEGTPHGKETTVCENIKSYIAHPATQNPHHAILLLTDVYGHTFRNAQLIADSFAQRGYLTLIPDLFDGTQIPFPIPADFNMQNWMDTTMPKTETVDGIVERVASYLRSELGIKKVGGVGYCFGGRYVMRWLKGEEGKGFDAGFVAHPSYTTDEELQGVKGPLSIAAAEVDKIFTTAERHKTEAFLEKMSVPWEMCVYGGTEHGFAVRGQMMTKEARFAKERVFEQAVGWFEEFVKKS